MVRSGWVLLFLAGCLWQAECRRSRCRDPETVYSQDTLLLKIRGRPRDLTDDRIALLEIALEVSYNSVAQCLQPGARRMIQRVDIERDAIDAFGDLPMDPDVGTATRDFTLPVVVNSFCTGCGSTYTLFRESTRRLIDPLQEEYSTVNATAEYGALKGSTAKSSSDDGGRRSRRSRRKSKRRSKNQRPGPVVVDCNCVAPLMDDVLDAFNQAVDINSVDQITGLDELSVPEDTCPAPSDFATTMVIDLTGDPNAVTPDQIDVLEQAILETYNELNALGRGDTCDPYSRIMTNGVALAIVSDNGLGPGTSAVPGGGGGAPNSFTVRVEAPGTCRGCPPDSALFEPEESLSMGSRSIALDAPVLSGSTGSTGTRFLQGGANSSIVDCQCAATAERRAPTEAEFLAAFNTTVQILREEGLLDSVLAGGEVFEVEEVECSADVNTFTTIVPIEYLVNPDGVTGAEVEALEVAFQQTYNDLVQGYCDPFFRLVVDVEITGLNQQRRFLRRLVDGAQTRSPTASPAPSMSPAPSTTPSPTISNPGFGGFVLDLGEVFVTAVCRGCPSNSMLFNDVDDTRRTLHEETDTFPFRRLEDSDTCYCDSNVPADQFRAPTLAEFQVAYNRTVSALGLPNVAAVTDVEPEYSNPTTESPTIPNTYVVDGGKTAAVFGDPHFITFDGLPFDGTAAGEFILVKSLDSSLEVQGRFIRPSSNRTIATGVVISGGDSSPTLQIAINEMDDQVAFINECPIQFYVNGVSVGGSLLEGSLLYDGLDVESTADGEVVATYTETNITLTVTPVKSELFLDCSLFFTLYIPDEYLDENEVTGMFGTPNNDATDDWITSTGAQLAVPNADERISETAFDYSTDNWCMRDDGDSLFTYEFDSFESYNDCDGDFVSRPDLTSAPPEVAALCGIDVFCLIDGIVGGVDAAVKTLTYQAAVDTARATLSRFRFEPAVITTDIPVNVAVTVDVNKLEVPDGLEGFAVFRMDPNTGQQGPVQVVNLDDIGSGLGEDGVAGDRVFSKELAVRAFSDGEAFGFKAIPIIDGSLDPSSSLVMTTLYGVRSYKDPSLSQNVTQNGTIVVDTLDDSLDVIITYSWPFDVRDLDTGTNFLGWTVGYACSPSDANYITFSGDNTGFGGLETIRVRVGRAYADGLWQGSTSITMNAGWYSFAGGSGPASISIATERLINGETVLGSAVSVVIEPGQQSSCSSTFVGSVDIEAIEEGATITLTTTVNA